MVESPPSPQLSAASAPDMKRLDRLVKAMRGRDTVVEMAEAYGMGASGMSGVTPTIVGQKYGIGVFSTPEKRTTFSRCRELYQMNDWVGSMIDLMILFCNDGLRINGIDPAAPELQKQVGGDPDDHQPMRDWLAKVRYKWGKLARDVFFERVLNSNAVLFWRDAGAGMLPEICVLNCEEVELHNVFGREWLNLRMTPRPVPKDAEELLDPRYVKALRGETLRIVNGEQGEYFRYLTTEKNGMGLRLAALFQAFHDLGVRDLLKMGDWNGAWRMKDVIRLVRRGHAVSHGPLSGQDIHFLKKREAKLIKKNLSLNNGAFDMVANFDVSVSYSYLDAACLEPKKYEGTAARLRAWAGPVARLLERGSIDADGMKLFETQINGLRGEVTGLLNEMFNDADFLGAENPPEPIQVTWSGATFLNAKLLLERARLVQASGIASTRTCREDMGLDHAIESERLLWEQAHPDTVTPAFEQKQGMTGNGKGGRPPSAPLPTPGLPVPPMP